MAFVGPPAGFYSMRPPVSAGYRPPLTGIVPVPAVATDGSKSQVKQVGNVLEIVPSNTLPAAAAGEKTAESTEQGGSSGADDAPSTGAAAAPSTTPAGSEESSVAGATATTTTSASSSSSSALVTPKIHTAEEIQQRHERRLELKKKIRAERERKRQEKQQRKERLQLEIKQLLGTRAPGGGMGAGGGTTGLGEALADGGSSIRDAIGGSASSDEEFEMVPHGELLASLNRSYEKGILKTAKPATAGGAG